MIISAIRILYDHHAPDPTYKNLYIYDPSNAGSLSPNAVPYAFFGELRIDQNTPIPKYDVPFPEGGTICPIGETEAGFTIEIPTDGDFPARPLYLILTTEIGYRYAFIDSYTRTASTKIRCVARFDQWTEHFADIGFLPYHDATHTLDSPDESGLGLRLFRRCRGAHQLADILEEHPLLEPRHRSARLPQSDSADLPNMGRRNDYRCCLTLRRSYHGIFLYTPSAVGFPAV